MRYSKNEKKIIVSLSIIIITFLSILSLTYLLVGKPIPFNVLYSYPKDKFVFYSIQYSFVFVLNLCLIWLLCLIIKGIFTGYKQYLRNKQYICALFINIFYLILYYPFYTYPIPRSAWIFINILGTFIIIIMLITSDKNKLEDVPIYFSYMKDYQENKTIFSEFDKKYLYVLSIVSILANIIISFQMLYIPKMFNNLDNIYYSAENYKLNFHDPKYIIVYIAFICLFGFLFLLINLFLKTSINNYKNSLFIFIPLILLNISLMILYWPFNYVVLITMVGWQFIHFVYILFVCTVLFLKYYKLKEAIIVINRSYKEQLLISIFASFSMVGFLIFILFDFIFWLNLYNYFIILNSYYNFSLIFYLFIDLNLFGLFYFIFRELYSKKSIIDIKNRLHNIFQKNAMDYEWLEHKQTFRSNIHHILSC